MPEVHFEVRWPDGVRMRYYSPSRAVRERLTQGHAYSTADFLQRVSEAMIVASERVRAKYGYACSSAADTLSLVLAHAETLSPEQRATGAVLIEHVDDPG